MAVNHTHNDGTIIGPAQRGRQGRNQQREQRRGGNNSLENLQAMLHTAPTREEVNARAAGVYQDATLQEPELPHTLVQDAVIKSITEEGTGHLVVSLGANNADEQLSQPIAQPLNEQTKDSNMNATANSTASKNNVALGLAKSVIATHAKNGAGRLMDFDLGKVWLSDDEANKSSADQLANLRMANNTQAMSMQMINNRVDHLETQLALTKAAATSATAARASAGASSSSSTDESFGMKCLKIGAVAAVYTGCAYAAAIGVMYVAGKILGDDE